MRSIRAMSFNPTTGGRAPFFHPFARREAEREKKSGRSFPGRPSPQGRTGSALGARRAQRAGKSLRRWVELRRPSDGCGQRTDPWPQYAFKVSMFNVSCNSH
ncbi:hypothetical protein ACOMHN_005895 [Nucella lapillus]